ncbi:MAG: hypothetical protein ISR83_00595 [Candidatus Marinimicrobia bacterium]|nr:hypothetical protein [Candidatus Neomarinimicrobiota bacterium]
MNSKLYFLISGILFGCVCLLYASTLFGNNTIVFGGYTLPTSVRLVATLLTGSLSFFGLSQYIKN